MTRQALALVSLALVSCSLHDRPERRFHGPLTPTTQNDRCAPSNAVLLLRDQKLTFTPDEGIWILEGTATADTLTAKRSRPTPDHKSYDTELKAKWTETEVHGAYTTPFCTYRLDLTAY